MRLPWLQVEQDGLAQCKRLARLLGVPDTQGIGIGVLVWQYAFEIAPEGDFRGFVPDPGILAVEVGWPVEDAPRLVTQLQRVGIIATTPSLRVRGLDRYIRAWEKNSGKKAKHWTSGDAVPEPGANPARITPEPARQTQTQTHTQTHTEAAAAAPAQPARSIDDASGWWRTAQDRREAAGLLREKEPHARSLSTWFSQAMLETNGDSAKLMLGYAAFLLDPFWRNDAKKLCAWNGWVDQWRDFVTRATAPGVVTPKKRATVEEGADWSNVKTGEVTL